MTVVGCGGGGGITGRPAGQRLLMDDRGIRRAGYRGIRIHIRTVYTYIDKQLGDRGVWGTWPPTSRLPMFNKLPPPGPARHRRRRRRLPVQISRYLLYRVPYYIPGPGFSYIIIIIIITAIFLIFTLPRVHCLPGTVAAAAAAERHDEKHSASSYLLGDLRLYAISHGDDPVRLYIIHFACIIIA